jgi:transposase-like protein
MDLINITEQFNTEDKARDFLEKMRWSDGVICPHCGVIGEAYKLTPKAISKTAVRKGVWKCKPCRKQFTVTVGTIFEGSHIPLKTWLLAIHLLCSSKKGMSAHQLHRMLGITYKSAWFMAHRIRYAMTQKPLSSKLTGTIEVDETYIGGKFRMGPQVGKLGERPKDRLSWATNKQSVVSVLQRGGRVQSIHVKKVSVNNLRPIIDQMVAENAHVMTDTSNVLASAKSKRRHDQVNHSKGEYVRYEDGLCITTNTVEGFFANLKRGIKGIYHHVGKQHLHRYLAEFDFRYNLRKSKDGIRTIDVVKGAEGKRLMLRDSRN